MGEWNIRHVLSEDCVDLLQNMLRIDPKKRYTLEEVSNHPWLAVVSDNRHHDNNNNNHEVKVTVQQQQDLGPTSIAKTTNEKYCSILSTRKNNNNTMESERIDRLNDNAKP